MIYGIWIAVSAVGLILLALGIIDTFRDFKEMDWTDLLFFAAGSILLIIGAINAATLDFVLPNGTIFTDQNEAWAIIPLFGLGFVSLGLALMVIVMSAIHRNDLTVDY